MDEAPADTADPVYANASGTGMGSSAGSGLAGAGGLFVIEWLPSFAVAGISGISGGHGSIGSISDTPRTIVYGNGAVFTITPDAGYYIENAVDNCGAAGASNGALAGSTYSTGAVTAACAVTARFTIATAPVHTVTAVPLLGPASLGMLSAALGALGFGRLHRGRARGAQSD